MTFSERMKDFMKEGAAVSRDLANKAGEKAQDWGKTGFKASKDFFAKAGAKAQDLGELGVLKIEIRQLEGQAQKLFARVGSEVYHILKEEGEMSVSGDNPVLSGLFNEIAQVREGIEKREAEIAAKGNAKANPEDLSSE